jgi:hypothetical protein
MSERRIKAKIKIMPPRPLEPPTDDHDDEIDVRRLPSGYWHVRGRGPCNWSQPINWPCSEEMLRHYAGPGASEEFIADAMIKAREVDHE